MEEENQQSNWNLFVAFQQRLDNLNKILDQSLAEGDHIKSFRTFRLLFANILPKIKANSKFNEVIEDFNKDFNWVQSVLMNPHKSSMNLNYNIVDRRLLEMRERLGQVMFDLGLLEPDLQEEDWRCKQ